MAVSVGRRPGSVRRPCDFAALGPDRTRSRSGKRVLVSARQRDRTDRGDRAGCRGEPTSAQPQSMGGISRAADRHDTSGGRVGTAARRPNERRRRTRLVSAAELRGAETRLGDALRWILEKEQGGPLAGVVAITDGRNNSGRRSGRDYHPGRGSPDPAVRRWGWVPIGLRRTSESWTSRPHHVSIRTTISRSPGICRPAVWRDATCGCS